MKPDIHPDYRPVIFYDVSADYKVLTRSTVSSRETMAWDDGKEYPVIRFDLSSASHAFYTGKDQQLSTKGGRIEQFRLRYAAQEVAAKEAAAQRAAAQEAEDAAGAAAAASRGGEAPATGQAAPAESGAGEPPAEVAPDAEAAPAESPVEPGVPAADESSGS